jgi:hypothetical protein
VIHAIFTCASDTLNFKLAINVIYCFKKKIYPDAKCFILRIEIEKMKTLYVRSNGGSSRCPVGRINNGNNNDGEIN